MNSATLSGEIDLLKSPRSDSPGRDGPLVSPLRDLSGALHWQPTSYQSPPAPPSTPPGTGAVAVELDPAVISAAGMNGWCFTHPPVEVQVAEPHSWSQEWGPPQTTASHRRTWQVRAPSPAA